MKIVLLNTYGSGGAATACCRLFEGLSHAGADVRLHLRDSIHAGGGISSPSGTGGSLRALLDGLPLHCYPGRQFHNFSPAWMPGNGVREAVLLSPDLVHLHWIPQGFVRIESLRKLTCPIVWTLHDSWPFTGGCHLPGTCRRYEGSCGACPVLGSRKERDWSRRIWQRKKNAWHNLNLTVVAPSRWMADRARASSLFARRRIDVIPNGVDTDLFSPGDRLASRRLLGLPEDRRLILFGANHAMTDANKGFDLLYTALTLLDERQRQATELMIIGARADRPVPDCGVPVRNLGVVADEQRLVEIYRAADLFVLPSRQENLPNMVLEAMACGIPCLAFDVGGLPELIRQGETGYLARPYDVGELARVATLLLASETRRMAMGRSAREWVEQHAGIERVVERHLALYQKLTAACSHAD